MYKFQSLIRLVFWLGLVTFGALSQAVEVCKTGVRCTVVTTPVAPTPVTSTITTVRVTPSVSSAPVTRVAAPATAAPTTTAPRASATTTAAPAISKPKATVTAVANPFVKVSPVVLAPRSGMTSVWRASLFNSANVTLDKNPSAAALPGCSAGQDGNCIASAPERKGTATTSDKDNDNVPAKPVERRRALVIGNTEYASPITSLPGTAKDALDISQALKDQGFDVIALKDASREGTVRAFNNLIRTTGEDDSVIVYYAGHGHIHPGSASGYWLPADADVENPKTWISNADITRMITNISAKQILLVSDSCFSGALTREGEVADSPAKSISANAILKRRSVAVMSSGSEEPVADSLGEGNSPFADALLKQLAAVGSNKEPLRAQAALNQIRTEVAKSSTQTPQYGVLMSAGHNAGGDYLLGIK